MGRPRTEDQFKKLVNLQAMVTRAEKKRLVAMRKATGLSISAILRAGLIKELENHERIIDVGAKAQGSAESSV